jgi:hypothetical protein
MPCSDLARIHSRRVQKDGLRDQNSIATLLVDNGLSRTAMKLAAKRGARATNRLFSPRQADVCPHLRQTHHEQLCRPVISGVRSPAAWSVARASNPFCPKYGAFEGRVGRGFGFLATKESPIDSDVNLRENREHSPRTSLDRQ